MYDLIGNQNNAGKSTINGHCHGHKIAKTKNSEIISVGKHVEQREVLYIIDWKFAQFLVQHLSNRSDSTETPGDI